MTHIQKALLWAAAIIIAAIITQWNGLSDSASFGITAGLSGAAIGSLYGKGPRAKRCQP